VRASGIDTETPPIVPRIVPVAPDSDDDRTASTPVSGTSTTLATLGVTDNAEAPPNAGVPDRVRTTMAHRVVLSSQAGAVDDAESVSTGEDENGSSPSNVSSITRASERRR
jgi:hypothetical protein